MGERLKIHLWGVSHGPAVEASMEGFPAGFPVCMEEIQAFLMRRAPGQNAFSSARKEGDVPRILSGLDAEGVTTGEKIHVLIPNTNARSGDYPDLHRFPRPGHADFAANLKYGDAWDHRGGGPFSARLTAPLCFSGALCMQYLKENYGVEIAAHIARIGSVSDALPDTSTPSLPLYEAGAFPVIDQKAGERMREEILAAKEKGDSVDGQVRCLVTGLPGGLGGPYFEGLEGKIAQGIFGIPAVKGILFGEIQHFGSQNNDAFCVEAGAVRTKTNHHGGILGGISTGMPLHFTVDFKPTPSIALPQPGVDMLEKKEKEMQLQGRHDPCVVPRAVPVVEAVCGIVLLDEILKGA